MATSDISETDFSRPNALSLPQKADKGIGKDNLGRFAKGNTFSAVYRNVSPLAKYRNAFQESISNGDWKKIILKAVEQAIDGDKEARRFVAEYLVGRPKETIDLNITQIDPVEIYRKIDLIFNSFTDDENTEKVITASVKEPELPPSSF
jgi:hypothetical protein